MEIVEVQCKTQHWYQYRSIHKMLGSFPARLLLQQYSIYLSNTLSSLYSSVSTFVHSSSALMILGLSKG